MAVNQPVGDNARQGAVRKRALLKTKMAGEAHWTKRSKESGRFMDVKKDASKFKGVAARNYPRGVGPDDGQAQPQARDRMTARARLVPVFDRRAGKKFDEFMMRRRPMRRGRAVDCASGSRSMTG